MIYQISKSIFNQLTQSDALTDLDNNIDGIINKIFEIDPEIADLLNEFKSKYEIHHFVRRDNELRSKMKDIWQFQCDRTSQDQETALKKLLDNIQSKNIKLGSELHKSS